MSALNGYASADGEHRAAGVEGSKGDDEERGDRESNWRRADLDPGGDDLRDHGAACGD